MICYGHNMISWDNPSMTADKRWLWLWCLTPLSTIFEFYWWIKMGKNPTELPQVTDKRYHILLYRITNYHMITTTTPPRLPVYEY